MNLHEEVIEMCLDVIEMERDEIGLNEAFESFAHIDSLKVLDILTGLERRFQIKIPEQEMREFETINKVIAVVQRHVAELALA